MKTYPRIVTCRWTGVRARVDGRPAEIFFRLMAPCVGFTALLVFAVLVLAAIGVLA